MSVPHDVRAQQTIAQVIAERAQRLAAKRKEREQQVAPLILQEVRQEQQEAAAREQGGWASVPVVQASVSVLPNRQVLQPERLPPLPAPRAPTLRPAEKKLLADLIDLVADEAPSPLASSKSAGSLQQRREELKVSQSKVRQRPFEIYLAEWKTQNAFSTAKEARQRASAQYKRLPGPEKKAYGQEARRQQLQRQSAMTLRTFVPDPRTEPSAQGQSPKRQKKNPAFEQELANILFASSN